MASQIKTATVISQSGSVFWTGLSNTIVEDGVVATVSVDPFTNPNTIQSTDFNFSILGLSTINGIQVRIKRFASVGAGVTDSLIQFISGEIAKGNNLAAGADWPLALGFTTFAINVPRCLSS